MISWWCINAPKFLLLVSIVIKKIELSNHRKNWQWQMLGILPCIPRLTNLTCPTKKLPLDYIYQNKIKRKKLSKKQKKERIWIWNWSRGFRLLISNNGTFIHHFSVRIVTWGQKTYINLSTSAKPRIFLPHFITTGARKLSHNNMGFTSIKEKNKLKR